jgi:hypothetical protein
MVVDEPGTARRDVGLFRLVGASDKVLDRERREDLTVRVSVHPDIRVAILRPRADQHGPAGRHIADDATFPARSVQLRDSEPAVGHPSVICGKTPVHPPGDEQHAPVRMGQYARSSRNLHASASQDGPRRRVEHTPLVHPAVGSASSPLERPKRPHAAGVVVAECHEGHTLRGACGVQITLPYDSARGVDAEDEAVVRVVDGGAQVGGDIEVPTPAVVSVLVPPGEGRLGQQARTVRRATGRVGRREVRFTLSPDMKTRHHHAVPTVIMAWYVSASDRRRGWTTNCSTTPP